MIAAAAAFGATATLHPAGPARAADNTLPAPAGKAILTISGKISQTNDGETARFDRPLLESFGIAKFTTTTPWYDKPAEFEGVPMVKLMAAVGAHGERIRAIALDDYVSEVPIADFGTYGTLLALKFNGEYMAVSDKGPCFIIYPFDSLPTASRARLYTRAVWQVSRIVVI